MSIRSESIFSRLQQKSSADTGDALYHRIYRFANTHRVEMKVALLYLASEHGISINRELRNHPEIRAQLQAIQTVPQKTATGAGSAKNQTKKIVNYSSKTINFESIPPFVTEIALKELGQNTEVYQMIYVFENSVREFINHVLKESSGNDWWNTTHHADDFKEKVVTYMQSEDDTPWVRRTNTHPLYYLELESLSTIITKASRIFSPYFSVIGKNANAQWLINIINDVNKVRRAIMHSNPITKDLYATCKSDTNKWLKQLPKLKKQKR